MSSVNKVMLVGRLTNDADEQRSADGEAELHISVMTTRRWMSRQGERRESTEWHDIRYSHRCSTGSFDRLGDPDDPLSVDGVESSGYAFAGGVIAMS